MQNEVIVDPENAAFARTMEVVTWVGLAALALAGGLYLCGVPANLSPATCAQNWELPVGEFWQRTQGGPVEGYAWFLRSLGKSDSLTILAVAILAMAPPLAIVAALTRTRAKLVFALLTILVLEFVFATLRPLFMAGGGH